MTLARYAREAAADALSALCADKHCGDVEGLNQDTFERIIALHVERAAKAFATDAIRSMTWVGVPNPFPFRSRPPMVTISLPSADNLHGLGFGSIEEAEAWREKAIAMVVDAKAIGGCA